MKRKNKPTLGILFLSAIYMVLCCLFFFSMALVTVKLIISHEVNIDKSDINHVLTVSIIAGVATAFRAWFFAKIDERKARKSSPLDPD